MSSSSYVDSNHNLVLRIANAHNQGKTLEQAGIPVPFDAPEKVAAEVARLIAAGAIERAVSYVADQRLDKTKVEAPLPSHMINLDNDARNRAAVRTGKCACDDTDALKSEIDTLKRENAELAAKLQALSLTPVA